MKLLALLIVIFALSVGVFAVEQEPPHADICTPSHVHNDRPCHCLAMGGWMDCKDGKRERESPGPQPPRCNNYCDKSFCECCKAVKR